MRKVRHRRQPSHKSGKISCCSVLSTSLESFYEIPSARRVNQVRGPCLNRRYVRYIECHVVQHTFEQLLPLWVRHRFKSSGAYVTLRKEVCRATWHSTLRAAYGSSPHDVPDLLVPTTC